MADISESVPKVPKNRFRRFLIKYEYMDKETEVRDFFFEYYWKPLFKWTVDMFLSTIPVALILVLIYPSQIGWAIIPFAFGVTIFLWYALEYIKQIRMGWKR